MLSNPETKLELLAHGTSVPVDIRWDSAPDAAEGSDVCIDLLFESEPERLEKLIRSRVSLVIVNHVIGNISLPGHFVRINAWPGFLGRVIVEAFHDDPAIRSRTESVFTSFNRSVSWTPDQPGFISSRVISMIINEAYFALEEKVSTKNEIDIAMKLGTNYPFGPFEWSERIGIKKVYSLLSELSQIDSKYEPAALLKQEATVS